MAFVRIVRKRSIPSCKDGVLAALLLFMFAACSTQPRVVKPQQGDGTAAPKPLYVVNHGWHTGFVVPASDLFDQLPGLKMRFPRTPYLELGWGDRDFYQANKMTLGLTLKAVFWPTHTVMRVAALQQSPQLYEPGGEIRVVCLTGRAYQSFIAFVTRSFSRDAAGGIVELDRGLYGNSQFYQAVGRYYLLNTCNTWTAKGLQSAGMAIAPRFKLTAGSVMNAIKTGHPCRFNSTLK